MIYLKNKIGLFVIVILLLVCGYLYLDNKGLLEFNTDTPTEDVEVPTSDVKTEENNNNENKEEEEDTKVSIFNQYFVYQGFIDNDSTQLSGTCESIVNKQYDECIIENGVDLIKMADCVVGDLSETTADNCTLLIYLNGDIDTKDLAFIVKGINALTLYGNLDESYEIRLNSLSETEIDVESYLKTLSMISIYIDDYDSLLDNGGFIKTM